MCANQSTDFRGRKSFDHDHRGGTSRARESGPRRSKMLQLARRLLEVEHEHVVPVSTPAQATFQCPACATPMVVIERLSAAKVRRLIGAHRDALNDSS